MFADHVLVVASTAVAVAYAAVAGAAGPDWSGWHQMQSRSGIARALPGSGQRNCQS